MCDSCTRRLLRDCSDAKTDCGRRLHAIGRRDRAHRREGACQALRKAVQPARAAALSDLRCSRWKPPFEALQPDVEIKAAASVRRSEHFPHSRRQRAAPRGRRPKRPPFSLSTGTCPRRQASDPISVDRVCRPPAEFGRTRRNGLDRDRPAGGERHLGARGRGTQAAWANLELMYPPQPSCPEPNYDRLAHRVGSNRRAGDWLLHGYGVIKGH